MALQKPAAEIPERPTSCDLDHMVTDSFDFICCPGSKTAFLDVYKRYFLGADN